MVGSKAAANEDRRGDRPLPPAHTTSIKMGYARLKYAVPENAAIDRDELPPDIDAVMPLGDPCHYRVLASKNVGSGYAEFCALSDGLFVHASDLDYEVPGRLVVTAPNMLRVRIASESNCNYVAARGDRFEMSGPGAAIIIEPAGMPPAEAEFVGRNRAVHVYLHRNHLKRLYARREHELPEVLRAFIAGDLQRTVARRIPLSPALFRCVDDLHSDLLEGHGRRLHYGSKALEILCHAFKALSAEEDAPEASALTTRGVLKAQKLLMENFVDPPSLDDLAQSVGLSRSGLCAGFRQVVGQTVFDYVTDLRMQHALALLSDRQQSITQIAFAVGYSHPSSFSLAVQRRFGTTPSKLRRRGLPAV